MKRLIMFPAAVIGAVWLLVGCTAAEWEAVNDSLVCMDMYPHDRWAQQQCMDNATAYRNAERINNLVRWCNEEVLAPMNSSLSWLDARLPDFENDYLNIMAWADQADDYYGYYCNTPEKRRAAPANCDKDILEDGLSEVNSLISRAEPLLTKEQHVQSMVSLYNKECTALDGAEWLDIASNVDFIDSARTDLKQERDVLSQAVTSW